MNILKFNKALNTTVRGENFHGETQEKVRERKLRSNKSGRISLRFIYQINLKLNLAKAKKQFFSYFRRKILSQSVKLLLMFRYFIFDQQIFV